MLKFSFAGAVWVRQLKKLIWNTVADDDAFHAWLQLTEATPSSCTLLNLQTAKFRVPRDKCVDDGPLFPVCGTENPTEALNALATGSCAGGNNPDLCFRHIESFIEGTASYEYIERTTTIGRQHLNALSHFEFGMINPGAHVILRENVMDQVACLHILMEHENALVAMGGHNFQREPDALHAEIHDAGALRRKE